MPLIRVESVNPRSARERPFFPGCLSARFHPATVGPARYQEFRHGDPVRITHGPRAGYEAIVDLHLKDPERVRVLLEVLRRFVPVQISPAQIRRCRPAG